MIRTASFYKQLQQDNLIAGGVGQGGGGYWQNAVGVRLQIHLAALLGANLSMRSRPHGRDSFDRRVYPVVGGPYDLAYCQLFECPEHRPADWVYSIISDYISMEGVLEEFLDCVRPDLMISFQYPLVPPSDRPDLVEQCSRYGTKVLFMPWFNEGNEKDWGYERDIIAMSTGKIGGTYPFRDKAYQYLEGLSRVGMKNDIVLSGNPHGSVFRLTDDEYRNTLRRCRYYVTGGIYDLQIPPKYYEICNFGATLVSPELPMMKEAGFVDGQTYVKIDSVDEIPAVLESDAWKKVGPTGRAMIHERHSLQARAQDIAAVYLEDQK